MKKIILASGSPRRKKILESLGVNFDIIPSDIEEILHPKLKPDQQAEYISKQKAKHLSKIVSDSIIVAADTTVVLGKKVLGKPKDKSEAYKMLKNLSGKMHEIITGVTIINQATNKSISKSTVSKIWFRALKDFEIIDYVHKFKPFDKAGGYGVQDIKDDFIKKIEGDYSNILGLPVGILEKELGKIGIKTKRIDLLKIKF